jgi:hypothetical protein
MGGALYDDLVGELRDGRIVAVGGAGVASATTDRNPRADWIGLLRHGVHRVADLRRLPSPQWVQRQTEVLDEATAGRGDLDDLLGVAEQISARLGAPDDGEWFRWLEETVGALQPTDDGRALLEAIAALGIPIATTNYDGLLEAVTGQPAVTWTQTALVVKLLRGEERGILHLHGFWREPGSVVLGIRDYQDVLGAGTAQHVQRVLPTLNGLLYIGCGAGLADPNFSALRRWIGDTLRGTTHRHFRLVRDRDVDSAQREHDRSEQTVVLGYGARFEDLGPFLRKLARDAGRAPPPSRVPTTSGAGPRLWLVETGSRSARERYATCEISVPSQDHQAGEPLRVRFEAFFHPLPENLPPLRQVEIGIILPPKRRAEQPLMEHDCPSGIRLQCRGRVRDEPVTWALWAPEPNGTLHGRSAAPQDDVPLFALPGPAPGQVLKLRMAAFANKDFYLGRGIAAPGAPEPALSRAKAAIIQKLQLDDSIGKPADTGEIILHVSEYAVEEAP